MLLREPRFGLQHHVKFTLSGTPVSRILHLQEQRMSVVHRPAGRQKADTRCIKIKALERQEGTKKSLVW